MFGISAISHVLARSESKQFWKSYKERTVDTLAPAAEEGRSKLRKATRSRYRLRSVGLRMGQPRRELKRGDADLNK